MIVSRERARRQDVRARCWVRNCGFLLPEQRTDGPIQADRTPDRSCFLQGGVAAMRVSAEKLVNWLSLQPRGGRRPQNA